MPENSSRVNLKQRILINAITKSLYWLLVNIFFGAFPILIPILIYVSFGEFKNPLDKIWDEGILLFLCAALCASVIVDYIFSSKSYPKYIEFGLYGCPFIILLFTSVVFSQVYFGRTPVNFFCAGSGNNECTNSDNMLYHYILHNIENDNFY